MTEIGNQGAQEASNVAKTREDNDSNYKNADDVEMLWAIKTHRQAEIYMKLISTMDPKHMKLTKFDEIIYRNFKRYFKHLPVQVINTEDFKSEESKAAWRPFCQQFKGKIEDYNFGTLLRIDCEKDYSENNTLLVTRIQFYAVELARNKRGLNKLHLNKNADTSISPSSPPINSNEENNNEKEISQEMDTLNTSDVADR